MEPMEHDLIVYQFSRSKVERGDFSHFLERFALDKLPTGRRLRELMNSMLFCVEGFDQDEREIYAIPEVRRFYSAFHDAWPYWLYFCNLDQDALKTMVLCCLPSFTAGKVDGNPNCLVSADPGELMQFLRQDFEPLQVICQRAQMFEHLIEGRKKAVLEFFGLPG
jgi:hypothetical protein